MNSINQTTKRGMFIFQLMFILLNLNKGYNKKIFKEKTNENNFQFYNLCVHNYIFAETNYLN